MTVAPIGVAITALVVTMTAVLVAPAGAGEPGARTMQEARAALERTEDQRDTAMRRLEALEEEHAATEREIANLDDSRAAFIEELQDARRQSREATVAAYVAGGGRARYAFESDYSSDSLWRQEVLSDHAQDNRDAQRHYRELRQKADEDVVYLADDLDAILARMDQTRGDIARFENRVPAIEAEIDVLRIIARYGGSRPDPGEAAWATLRSCDACCSTSGPMPSTRSRAAAT